MLVADGYTIDSDTASQLKSRGNGAAKNDRLTPITGPTRQSQIADTCYAHSNCP